MSNRVIVNEVGLRDGLQNQPRHVATADKLAMLDAMLAAGIAHVEATSFVSAAAVPQMADAAQIMGALPHRNSVDYSVLVPNAKGYQRATATGATSVAVVLACTEGMNRANIRMSLAEATRVCGEVMGMARADGLTARAYLATSFHCPFEGAVDPAVVHGLAETMFRAGAGEIIVADTIGAADPQHVGAMFDVLVPRHGAERLSGHFHDTQGLALANCFAALERGIRKFDASVGGLGGCPFAPGAAGNVATEDVVNMLHRSGYDTGIDLVALTRAVEAAERAVQRPLGGRWLTWQRGLAAKQAAKASA